MKTDYSIEYVPATPKYILACLREEWRQCAMPDGENEGGKGQRRRRSLHNSVNMVLVLKNREMNRILPVAWSCGLALILATGCRPYRTREFAAVQQPMEQDSNQRLHHHDAQERKDQAWTA